LLHTVACTIAEPSRPEDAGAELAADHVAVAPAGVAPVGTARVPAAEGVPIVAEDVVTADIADGGHAIVLGEVDGEAGADPAAAPNRAKCEAADVIWFPGVCLHSAPHEWISPQRSGITMLYLLSAMYDDT
jgi:hypothetical protein